MTWNPSHMSFCGDRTLSNNLQRTMSPFQTDTVSRKLLLSLTYFEEQQKELIELINKVKAMEAGDQLKQKLYHTDSLKVQKSF